MTEDKSPLYFYLFFIEGIVLSYLYIFFPLTVLFFLIVQFLLLVLKPKSIGESCAKFKSLQTLPHHCYNFISGYGLKNDKRALLLLIVLSASFLYGSVAFHREFNNKIDKELMLFQKGREAPTIHSRVHLIDLPRQSDYGFLYECNLEGLEDFKDVKMYFFSPVALEPGCAYEGDISLRVRLPRRNPGEYLKKTIITIYPEGEMVKTTDHTLLSYIQRLRWRVYRYFSENFDKDTSSLLSAIVIGHRGGNRELYRAYSTTGIAHLMSVSGTHFGLFTITAFFMVRMFAFLIPYKKLLRLTGRISLKELELLLILPVIVFYLLLSGMRIPAIRAFIMINLFILGVFIGRRGSWLTTLLFACFVILIINPAAIVEASMQLSFMAVFSIGLGIELSSTYVGKAKKKPSRIALNFLVITVSAFLGTLPLTLYYFHSLSSFSVFTNMVITPLVCFILLPLSLFSTVVYMLSGIFPLTGIIGATAELINNTVVSLSEVSFSSIRFHGFPFVFVLLIYVMAFSIIKRRKYLFYLSTGFFITAAIISFSISRISYPVVTFLDVGQGDSAVIENSDGRTIVIDTGNTGREVLDYLSYRGKGSIDVLVLSHADRDHTGGLWNILKNINVSSVWDNGLMVYRPDIERITSHVSLKAGDVIAFPEGRFEILHPHSRYHPLFGDDENNYSLVLRYVSYGYSVLFTGDIGSDAEESITELPVNLKTDVLKVAHHGSYTSSTEYFLKAVSPLVSIISVGANNIYGHPNSSTLKRLAGTEILRTDRDGAVRVFSDSNTVQFRAFKNSMLSPVRFSDYRGEFENLKRIFMFW
ncbi:MAG: DNA internalization-related competence protein ComEC/Rec2 [Nitrospirae bacterium]|nr:DNA internalization-related competence protein ComEC/Rec2 [Nitrospirota bacterium]